MTNLIKSEMKKIFHKKSFYIVTIIFVLYAILTNVIYKSIDDFSINDPEVTIEELEKENSRLDLNVKENLDKYVTNLSNIEIKKMEDTYKNGEYLINKYVFPLVYQANLLEYMEKDLEESNIVRTKIDEYLNKIKDNDWKYFASMRMSELKNISNEDKDEKTDIYIKLTEYRIKNNIPYDEDNYLNNALIDVENNLSEYYNLKNKKTSKEEQERLDYLKEEMLVNKYILEHQKDIKNNESLKGVLSNFASEFGLFILIYVIMLSGSIVSEEYNKGTIKNLLTKPFKRRTILTSKLLTVLILMPIIILIIVVLAS